MNKRVHQEVNTSKLTDKQLDELRHKEDLITDTAIAKLKNGPVELSVEEIEVLMLREYNIGLLPNGRVKLKPTIKEQNEKLRALLTHCQVAIFDTLHENECCLNDSSCTCGLCQLQRLEPQIEETLNEEI